MPRFNDENCVIIMRGITGSGKTTIAKQFNNAIICSADDYFKEGEKVIDWNWSELKTAHEYCREQFAIALENKAQLIIIDNTNIKYKDMIPYISVSQSLGYKVKILQVDCPAEIACRRSKHNAKYTSLKRQILNMNLETQNIPENIEHFIETGY